MNRDIKFRAWNKVDKTMYENAISNCKDTFDMILKHPQIYEVMQYIGLKDKDSVEIYEGDIILIDGELKVQIVYYDCAFRFKDDNSTISTYDIHKYTDRLEYEVIGNVFENPELVNK